jgi:hypothetical protein
MPSHTIRKISSSETMESAIERQKIQVVSEEGRVRQRWPDAPERCEIVIPGRCGDTNYIIEIRDRLKAKGFHFNFEAKVWYRTARRGIEAFNLGGVVPKVSDCALSTQRAPP